VQTGTAAKAAGIAITLILVSLPRTVADWHCLHG